MNATTQPLATSIWWLPPIGLLITAGIFHAYRAVRLWQLRDTSISDPVMLKTLFDSGLNKVILSCPADCRWMGLSVCMLVLRGQGNADDEVMPFNNGGLQAAGVTY